MHVVLVRSWREVNWDTALANIDKTFGGPQASEEKPGQMLHVAPAFILRTKLHTSENDRGITPRFPVLRTS